MPVYPVGPVWLGREKVLSWPGRWRQVDQRSYSIDLAGGWLDQPFVSKYYPGAVITVSIEPTIEWYAVEVFCCKN